MLLAAVIGGYTLIGGLGATFYVSYFNTALIFVLILMLVVEVFYNPFNNPENPFGDSKSVYDFIACWKAPNGNRDESYLTFFSPGKFRNTVFLYIQYLLKKTFLNSLFFGLLMCPKVVKKNLTMAYRDSQLTSAVQPIKPKHALTSFFFSHLGTIIL